jgi:peptide/bleomycin uptake transporter
MFRSFFLSRRWALWAWGGLFVLVALVFITVQQTVKLNAWYGEFYDLLQKPEQAGGLEKFWGFMQQFALIAQALTEEYLPRWQRTDATVEGASQRIQEDCMRFARQTENLGLGLVRALLTLVSFIPILWALSTGMAIVWLQFEGSLFWVALATALGGTVISWFVGIRLPGLEYNNQRTEAALRKDLVYAEDDRSRMHLPTVLELFMGVRLNNFRLFNHYAYFHLWPLPRCRWAVA